MINKELFYKIEEFYSQDEGGNWKDGANDRLLTTIITRYGVSINYEIGLSEDYTSGMVGLINQVWKMVRDEYFEYYIYKKEIGAFEDIPNLTSEDCKKVLQRVANIFDCTIPRYVPLLKKFKESSTNPLPKIKIETNDKRRFNDTPQSDDLNDGYYSDDSHATNVNASVSSTESDAMSLIEQLDKLFTNWRSIIKDWLNEFKGIFMEVWR